MKATGIVRRIDDLGRVVIPKEIRRTMRIREGDPLEIYTDREGEVIFKKYSPIGELMDFASEYAETLYKTCNMPVAVCDRDCIIACAGVPKKEFLEKKKSNGFTIREEDGIYIVEAEWLIPILSKIDYDDYESLQYLQRVLVSSGIMGDLENRGIQNGDTVSIYDIEFDYIP